MHSTLNCAFEIIWKVNYISMKVLFKIMINY